MSEKVKAPEIKAGQNVIVEIGGKKVVLYCVQIVDGAAELQGAEAHRIPVGELKPVG